MRNSVVVKSVLISILLAAAVPGILQIAPRPVDAAQVSPQCEGVSQWLRVIEVTQTTIRERIGQTDESDVEDVMGLATFIRDSADFIEDLGTPQPDDWAAAEANTAYIFYLRTLASTIEANAEQISNDESVDSSEVDAADVAFEDAMKALAEACPGVVAAPPVATSSPSAVIPVTLPGELWRAETGSSLETSPVVGGDTVFVTTSEGALIAYDAATGTERWRSSHAYQSNYSPVYSEGLLFVYGEQSNLYAIDASTGAEKWRFSAKAAFRSMPSVTDGVVCMATTSPDGDTFADGILYTIDITEGELVASHPIGAFVDDPTVLDGIAYQSTGDRKGVLATNCGTGETIWSYSTNDVLVQPITVADGSVFYGTSEALGALDAANGQERWRIAIDYRLDQPLVYADDAIYAVMQNHRYITQLNAATGAATWTFDALFIIGIPPLAVDGVVYLGYGEDEFFAVDVQSGKLIWSLSIEGEFNAAPAVAGGIIYFGIDDGTLYAISASGAAAGS